MSEIRRSKKTVIKGSILSAPSLYGGKFFEYVNHVLLGRFLGPEFYGLYRLSVAVLNLGSVFSLLGFRTAIPRFVSQHVAKGKPENNKGTLIFSFIVLVPLSIVIGVFVYAGSDLIAITLFSKYNLAPFIRYIALIIPIVVSFEITTNYLLGLKYFGLSSFYRKIALRFLFFLLIISFLFLNILKVSTTILGLGIAYLIIFAISFVHIAKSYLPNVRANLKQLGMISYSWPLAITSVLNQSKKRIDLYALAYFLSGVTLGWYSACFFLANLISLPALALTSILLPVLAELEAKGARREIAGIYSSIVDWLSIVLVPLFFIIVLFGEFFISVLFGKDYLFPEFKIVLTLLTFSISFSHISGPKLKLLQAAGKTKKVLFINVTVGVITILLAVLLVWKLEILGAAVSVTVGMLVNDLMGLYYVRRLIDIRILNQRFVKIICSGIFCFLLVFVIQQVGPFQDSILSNSVLIIIYLVSYLATQYLVKPLREEDILLLKKLVKRIVSKQEKGSASILKKKEPYSL